MDWRIRRACEQWLHSYNRAWRKNKADEAQLARQRASQPEMGLVSFVIPVWNTRPQWLHELAAALKAQTLSGWEAVLYDGCSDNQETLAALREISTMDSRLRVIRGEANLGISGNTNLAVAQTRGEWLAFCDHDDLVEPDALWQLLTALRDSGADAAYSDEDRISEDGKTHYAPHLKPELCPENLLCCNYICHLTMMRRSLFDQVGGLRPETDGSQDHDLMLRCVKAEARITHVPKVLYHWRNNGGSMSHAQRDRCMEAARVALTTHLEGTGADVDLRGPRPRVAWPWPKDQRVLVLVTGTESETALCRDLMTRREDDRIRVLAAAMEDIPRMIREADSELILLWDPGVVPDTNTVGCMASLACRREVGCVYPTLLTTSGRILSAGMGICQDGSLFHRSRGMKPWTADPLLLETSVHQVSLGSSRCVMLKRSLCPQDGPIDSLWALSLQRQGLRNLVTPFALAMTGAEPQPKVTLLPGTPDPCLIGPQLAQRNRRKKHAAE